MEEQFQPALNLHFPAALRERSETRWGWKAPRSIYLLPFLRRQFPALKFIHVLRDGRDMALSPNQNQLQKHGPAVLNWRERFSYSLPERSFLLWQRINVATAEFGESELRANYLRVRFEDLCETPVEITGEIFKFLGATIDPQPVARAEISPPATLQRWQTYPPGVAVKIEKIGSDSLRRFGYQL